MLCSWSFHVCCVERQVIIVQFPLFKSTRNSGARRLCQAMSELWEEDPALRKALPWKALTLQAPRKEMRSGHVGLWAACICLPSLTMCIHVHLNALLRQPVGAQVVVDAAGWMHSFLFYLFFSIIQLSISLEFGQRWRADSVNYVCA